MESIISIKVLPRSSKNEIVGTLPDGTLKIKLTAPPVDGAANEALIEFLSQEWSVSKSCITIIKGLRGRQKVVRLIR